MFHSLLISFSWFGPLNDVDWRGVLLPSLRSQW
jgi:hypothetical protein